MHADIPTLADVLHTVPLPLVAFIGQFLFVFLLGFQMANVRDRRYRLSFLTSFAISTVEFTVLVSVVRVVVVAEGGLFTWLGFALGGAYGIVMSMLVADWKRSR